MKVFSGLGVFLAAALTACSSTPEGEPVGEAAPVKDERVIEAPAFHFRSGDLVLGSFDPHSIGADLFNPCAEITDEEFAAAGFSGKQDLGYDPATQKAACFFATEDPDIQVGFLTTAANRDTSSEQAHFLDGIDSGNIPGAYFYEPDMGAGICFAVVDTERGAFGAAANSYFLDTDVTPLCERASRALQALYNL